MKAILDELTIAQVVSLQVFGDTILCKEILSEHGTKDPSKALVTILDKLVPKEELQEATKKGEYFEMANNIGKLDARELKALSCFTRIGMIIVKGAITASEMRQTRGNDGERSGPGDGDSAVSGGNTRKKLW